MSVTYILLTLNSKYVCHIHFINVELQICLSHTFYKRYYVLCKCFLRHIVQPSLLNYIFRTKCIHRYRIWRPRGLIWSQCRITRPFQVRLHAKVIIYSSLLYKELYICQSDSQREFESFWNSSYWNWIKLWRDTVVNKYCIMKFSSRLLYSLCMTSKCHKYRIWNEFSLHTVFMKRVVCFISQSLWREDIKHTSFINTVWHEKFTSDSFYHMINMKYINISRKSMCFEKIPHENCPEVSCFRRCHNTSSYDVICIKARNWCKKYYVTCVLLENFYEMALWKG